MKVVEIDMRALKLWITIFLKFLVNTLSKTITHHRWPTTSLFIMNIRLPIFEHFTPLSYSSFVHYTLAINWEYFTMDFCSTHIFSMKKADNSMNLAAGGNINRRTHHNSLCREKEQTLDDQLYNGLQGNKSCDTTSHAKALPCSYISCLK
jgi:hypothetical protein